MLISSSLSQAKFGKEDLLLLSSTGHSPILQSTERVCCLCCVWFSFVFKYRNLNISIESKLQFKIINCRRLAYQKLFLTSHFYFLSVSGTNGDKHFGTESSESRLLASCMLLVCDHARILLWFRFHYVFYFSFNECLWYEMTQIGTGGCSYWDSLFCGKAILTQSLRTMRWGHPQPHALTADAYLGVRVKYAVRCFQTTEVINYNN